MKHLEEIGESYFTHWLFAFRFSLVFILVGLAIMVHAFFPNLFITTGSDAVKAMATVLQDEEK